MLYYTEPSQEMFDEVKEKAIEVWKENYSDEFGYVTEKVDGIKDLQNIKDNLMFIVARFDISNQRILSDKLSDGAKEAIRERMLDGGTPAWYIVF